MEQRCRGRGRGDKIDKGNGEPRGGEWGGDRGEDKEVETNFDISC